jgi:hypothetical protein
VKTEPAISLDARTRNSARAKQKISMSQNDDLASMGFDSIPLQSDGIEQPN